MPSRTVVPTRPRWLRMYSGNNEIEITFAIQSDEPLRVVANLEQLTRLGDRVLRPRPALVLHDRHFDLADAALRRRGYGLRLRYVAGCWLLCLKGRSRRRGLAVELLEIEGSPADPALRTSIAAEIGPTWPDTLGPTLTATDALVADPVGALTAAGFVLIQDRQTLRRERDVVDAEHSATAQLAIDTVTYVISGTPMRHHEVEIEAGNGMDSNGLERLAADMLATFPAVLLPWRPSKLSTGLALDALARRVGAAALVSSSGHLFPQAYALLLEQLRQGPP